MEFGTTREVMRGFTKLEPTEAVKKREYRSIHFGDTLDHLATALQTNLETGISDTDNCAKRKATFGENTFASMPMKTYCEFVYESFEDPVLLILLGAVVIAFVVGMIEHPSEGWIEGTAIFIAVIVVSQVTAASDYNKQAQFAELYATAENDQGASVIRNGREVQLQKAEIVVGDIVVLRAGVKLPADGLLIPGTAAGSLACDEADLTGESLPQVKSSTKDDYFHADTNVKSGSARVLIVAVGSDTITGQIKEDMMEKEDEETPLQKKLNTMVDLIGYVGVGSALLTLVALLIRQAVDAGSDGLGDKFLDSFIVAVTIVVVAVPEGLPLAVTIALAYSMGAMYHDHIFVKVLSACETMGGATCICSDKTGTLTQNIMSVAGFWCADKSDIGHEGGVVTPSLPTDEMKSQLLEMIALNSEAAVQRTDKTATQKADDVEKGILTDSYVQRTGSATDCALLELHERVLGSVGGWAAERASKNSTVIVQWPFSSVVKKMGVAVKLPSGGVRLWVKGAGEKLLGCCSTYVDKNGTPQPLQSALFEHAPAGWMSKMQNQGFRVIALCYADYSSEAQLLAACGGSPGDDLAAQSMPDTDNILFGAAAIHDPLRVEVPQAVADCARAGVRAVMVTGDAKPTAMYIAKSCNIYNAPVGVYEGEGNDEESGIAIEAVVYRRLYDAAFLAQFGTRKCRGTVIESVGEEKVCKPIEAEGDEGWKCLLDPSGEFTTPGNRLAADTYSGFDDDVAFSSGQLDAWAFGVRNEYDDSSWDAADREAIDRLKVKATELQLGCEEINARWSYNHNGVWTECDDWCCSELEMLQRDGKDEGSLVAPSAASNVFRDVRLEGANANVFKVDCKPCEGFLVPLKEEAKITLKEEVGEMSEKLMQEMMQAGKTAQAEVCEKLGLGILPPLDMADREYIALSDKMRVKQSKSGGPLAQLWWAKVDALLYGVPSNVIGSKGLQVMARSLPDDKLKLVKRFMTKGEVVGVTGDGTNDAPALRHANVGLAMGTGTDVAKDAAEITITNDNFASIVLAIMWGRNIFDNIRKFLQFQLTVNVVALLLTFIMACVEDGRNEVKDALPLNAVMLLWVNLIMDSMGALALATEKPSPQLLDRKPHGRERLLSVSMMRMVVGQSIFQLVVLLVLSTNNNIAEYVCDCDVDLSLISTRQKTTVFNAFVFCQFFNEINCRTIKEMNVFSKFFDSPWFTLILIFTAALQCFMVEVGGDFVGTNGLDWRSWLVTIAIGAIAIPVGALTRLINVDALEAKYGSISQDELEEELEELAEEENAALQEGKAAAKLEEAQASAKVQPEEETKVEETIVETVNPLEVKTEN